MPIYLFKCRCGAEFEKMCKMKDTVAFCKCGQKAKKIPSLPNFHLKGGGWFKDGYSKDKNDIYSRKHTFSKKF